ncbi:MAG TPA: amidohydrolase family protein [Candidatus Binataceae bacterium]|nr:amidohydrolase family protein [Candidatus Binataceae bacterium]
MGAGTNSSGSLSKSAKVRAQLKHPVIDSDGHTVEFQPALREYLAKIGGPKLAERYRSDSANWYKMTPEQRRTERPVRPPWWALPTKNTLDRATGTFPKLQYERLDETGIDFAILYPTAGLGAPHIRDEELRRATCRAFNTFHSDIFREYADRLTPAAVIPMHTPKEAIDELEFAVKTLGLKVIMMAGHVRRPIPAVADSVPNPTRHAYWLDLLALDSEYDYDPVWAKCVELGVAPSFHSAGMGWGSRTSPSNYMFNHIGHFAAAGEAICKALFFGGVTRRFPKLKFAFLECGVGWAANLYTDLIGHWVKRNRNGMDNYNPANLDREVFYELARRYGGKLVEGKLDRLGEGWGLSGTKEDSATLDDWSRCGIEKPEDIRSLFVPNFYFGCEADDPINAIAFDPKKLPFKARLNAIFSSDMGHWDVPDMTEVTEEAYEMVEHGQISEEDFRDFVFANPARLWAGMNPNFFKGTRVEDAVKKISASGA